MRKGLKTTLLLLACSTISAVAAVGLYDYYRVASSTRHSEVREVSHDGGFSQPTQMRTVAFGAEHAPQDFVEVAERSINGVVNIRAEYAQTRRESRRQIMDPFEFFFGPYGNQEGMGSQPARTSIGSGVIISDDGYIITNNHVVENATKVTVTSNDNREWEAKVIGTDPATDIALLKIEATDLSPLPFGDSEKLRVGEWVLAIGNPFNLSSTVTAGIVSAKGRSTISGQGDGLKIASFIQTDAAVNPGNSGGALVNTRGELVGINTMIFSQTGNFAGYSFAVPVSIASKVVADIKQYGAVQRAVLGIVGSSITSDLTKKYDLKVTEGAVVVEFAERSPAKSAGLVEGDVITSVNGTSIRNMAELQEQVSKYRPGDKVALKVNRKGKAEQLSVTLKNTRGTTEVVSSVSPDSLGAAFKSLSAQQRDRLGLDFGVEVVGVDNGKFKEAGITKGFIILTINNKAVSTPEDVESIVKSVLSGTSDKVLFIKGVYSNGRVKYIAVDLN